MSSSPEAKKKPTRAEQKLEKKSRKKSIDLKIKGWSNEKHTVEASAKEGFLCRVTVDAKLPMTPAQLFGVFSHPDNSHIFRDLGTTVKYKVVEDDGAGHQSIELEQRAVLKFLAIPYKFSTFLRVDLDFNNNTMHFKLAKKGMMKKFDGGWTLEPLMEGDKVIGCKARLVQDVLPIFVPPFLANLLTGVATHVVIRMLEDLEILCRRLAEGVSMSDLLGWTKWIDQNETLKSWRQEMDMEWSKGKDEKAVNQGQDEKAVDNGKDEEAVDNGKDEEAVDNGKDEKVVDKGKDERAVDKGKDEKADDKGKDEKAVDQGEEEKAFIQAEPEEGAEIVFGVVNKRFAPRQTCKCCLYLPEETDSEVTSEEEG